MQNIKNKLLISRCYNIFSEAIGKRVFPGAAMAVAWGIPGERRRIIQVYGYTAYDHNNKVEESTVYDLASLTKPLATTLAILVLLKEQRIKLHDLVSDIFPQTGMARHRISVRNILSHSAGFLAYKPYYLELCKVMAGEKGETLLNLLAKENQAYKPGTHTLYSDLGFMLLGLIVEKKSGLGLTEFFREKIAAPVGLTQKLFYSPIYFEHIKKHYAPTEDCLLRKKILIGEVSDENAHALGGVAGHAGLFGTIGGVLEMGVHLLDQWQGREEHPNYQASDLCQFLTRQNIPDSTWALGFDTPSSIGSSGGRYLAPTSVGHLGFTGTSFWIDPTRNLVMVLLSNRVHPSRENNQIKQFRPLFHETVMESLNLV